MQCLLVLLLAFAFLGFERGLNKRRGGDGSLEATAFNNDKDNFPKQLENFDSLLIEFHKAQCYFGGTLQIAALAYDIFEIDLLKTFMLIPLAINGVLPITFSYLLLFRWRHLPWRKAQQTTDVGVVLVTFTCWILSSIVYWTLYAHLIPTIGSEEEDPYQQFFYKLSAIRACGSYSALALCQTDFFKGNERINSASRKLRRLTPIIWTVSTVCLLTVLFCRFYPTIRRRMQIHLKFSEQPNEESGNPNVRRVFNEHSHRLSTAFFYLAILFLVAGIGMQLSLLTIGSSLNMMNYRDWSFGQIVAVTIWAPPLMGYAFTVITTIKIRKFWGNYSRVPRKESENVSMHELVHQSTT